MPTLSAEHESASLCPVCHSEEPHNRMLCSNSPETLADYFGGLQSDTAELVGPNPNISPWAVGYDSWKLANGGR